tara:strand:- start:240 stop:398 length:159 start_codon:yes stop_codon:yes gene_type:complete
MPGVTASAGLIIPFIRILVSNFDQGEKSATARRKQDNTTQTILLLLVKVDSR